MASTLYQIQLANLWAQLLCYIILQQVLVYTSFHYTHELHMHITHGCNIVTACTVTHDVQF